MSFKGAFWLTILLLMMAVMLGASSVPIADPLEQVRTLTRPIEFDYVSWTLEALGLKLGQAALDTASYVSEQERSQTVLEALELIRRINALDAQIYQIYSDPTISNPDEASQALRDQGEKLQDQREQIEPVAEAILQDQIGEIAAQAGLTLGGQAFPPVLYHTTPPPDALIISPRDVIRQDENISISPDISVDQMEELEGKVDKALDVSSLVVGIGGIGLYPTMVMETTDINNLAEVIAHEWVHNYLTIRPLGFSYANSPELRIMNETVAAIAGKELGRAVVKKYYPQFLPPETPPRADSATNTQPATPPVFDFNAEMHATRVKVDQLLAAGKVKEAETYMEQRRVFFWEHGYQIRKLNQAYFAFYGAYADQPGGAAGADPVGAAVRLLRQKNSTLADFINQIAWMWKFDQLTKAVGTN
ncbi:MAG: hypothetical protein FIA98_06465 [Anaerolineae bacterium]|nr:hypothetical protein [Anaerolineae bacterium]